MSRRAILGLILLLAAIGSGWWAWQLREARGPEAAAAQRSDYVLHDFELQVLGKDGRESLRLQAPLLERSRQDESLAITTPRFLVPTAQGPWTLRAERAWVAPGAELARLEGGVAGDSDPAAGNPTSFRTGWLELLPEQDLARTDDQVEIRQPGIIQTGTGLQADLKNRQYRLLSQVRTRYEPSARR